MPMRVLHQDVPHAVTLTQVIDEAKGPITKKEFEMFDATAGDSLFGQLVDFLGVPLGSSAGAEAGAARPLPAGSDKTRPLLNQQVR